MEKITKFILNLREEFLQNQYAGNYRQINNGWCVAFAEEVESTFIECECISNDFFMEDIDEGWNGNEKDRWDLMRLLGYNSPPPISVEELTNQVSGYHRWVYLKGKHYDAECPYGVENLFELPFFKRYLQVDQEKEKQSLLLSKDNWL